MYDVETFYNSVMVAFAYGFLFGSVAVFFKTLGRGVRK